MFRNFCNIGYVVTRYHCVLARLATGSRSVYKIRGRINYVVCVVSV